MFAACVAKGYLRTSVALFVGMPGCVSEIQGAVVLVWPSFFRSVSEASEFVEWRCTWTSATNSEKQQSHAHASVAGCDAKKNLAFSWCRCHVGSHNVSLHPLPGSHCVQVPLGPMRLGIRKLLRRTQYVLLHLRTGIPQQCFRKPHTFPLLLAIVRQGQARTAGAPLLEQGDPKLLGHAGESNLRRPLRDPV